MYLVEDFYKNYEQELGLRIIAGQLGLNRVIRKPEAQRPGLSLSGYIPHFVKNRVMVIGRTEMGYMQVDSKRIVAISALESIDLSRVKEISGLFFIQSL